MSAALRAGLAGAMTGLFGTRNVVPTTRTLSAGTIRQYPQAMYELMRALDSNTNAYKSISDVLGDYGLEHTALQGLRNPTHAVTSFYEANLWPGTIREDDDESALPLRMPKHDREENLRAAIHQVMRWSNWNDNKDGAAHDAAMLGDQVFKVVSDRAQRRAWFELIGPEYMTDLDVDGRGYLTYLRLDVPQVRRARDGTTETFIHTEIWDKEHQRYRRWERSTALADVDNLGTPAHEQSMEQLFGLDFVPFVHWRFDRTSSDARGVPAIMRALDKIIYGDALVSSLHQRLARHGGADWALEGTGRDEDGLPLPPPAMDEGDGEEIELPGGGTFWKFPAGWSLKSLVAGLDYTAHLAVIESHYRALREYDLQELTWGTISEAGDASGRALNYKLTPAKSKLDKARGRGESSLIRAVQMCLSVAQQLGAPGFGVDEIGMYTRGDLDFWFGDRPLVPLSQQELSEMETARVARVKGWTDAGMEREGAMLMEDYSEEQVTTATTFATGVER